MVEEGGGKDTNKRKLLSVISVTSAVDPVWVFNNHVKKKKKLPFAFSLSSSCFLPFANIPALSAFFSGPVVQKWCHFIRADKTKEKPEEETLKRKPLWGILNTFFVIIGRDQIIKAVLNHCNRAGSALRLHPVTIIHSGVPIFHAKTLGMFFSSCYNKSAPPIPCWFSFASIFLFSELRDQLSAILYCVFQRVT